MIGWEPPLMRFFYEEGADQQPGSVISPGLRQKQGRILPCGCSGPLRVGILHKSVKHVSDFVAQLHAHIALHHIDVDGVHSDTPYGSIITVSLNRARSKVTGEL
jgi:hypothetical protein